MDMDSNKLSNTELESVAGGGYWGMYWYVIEPSYPGRNVASEESGPYSTWDEANNALQARKQWYLDNHYTINRAEVF